MTSVLGPGRRAGVRLLVLTSARRGRDRGAPSPWSAPSLSPSSSPTPRGLLRRSPTRFVPEGASSLPCLSVPSGYWSPPAARSKPAPSIRERRSSSAMRPSICNIARSMMCSSSAGFERSGAGQRQQVPPRLRGEPPRSCGPNTRKVIIHSSLTLDRTESKKGRKCDAPRHRSSPYRTRRFPAVSTDLNASNAARTVTYDYPDTEASSITISITLCRL